MKFHFVAAALSATLLTVTTAHAQGAPKAKAQDAATKAQPKALQSRVWVNNNVKIYHCPGNPYYGKTLNGEFMEEAQARAYGIRAFNRTACPRVATPERAPLPDSTPAARRMVWLNTESGVYHCPNTADWGTTRRGRYINEFDAGRAGARPAGGKKCPLTR